MTNDLNNIRFYAQIVERGSLTAAAESLGVAKSMLSQHLAALERELGVLLIRRTSRRLEITEIGKRYYAQCQVILGEIARASSLADSARTAPRGKLRIACPVNFAQVVMAPVVAAYLAMYPEVDLSLAVTNRANALIDEGFDFALYIGSPVKQSTLVTSAFKLDAEVLVASPGMLARAGTPRSPSDLGAFSSASEHAADARGRHLWQLTRVDGTRHSVQHFPRLLTDDLWVIRESVLAGCTIAALPPLICRDALEDGRLLRVLPDWTLKEVKLQLLYRSKKGLTLAARTLIDFLSRHLRAQLRGLQDGTMRLGTIPARVTR
jgi:DNA-binding transcriptional LysR family regulator